MPAFGTESRFGGVAQILHWLTALLVLAAFLVSSGGPPSRVYGDANAASLLLHESLGLAIFILVGVRLLWRSFDRIPDEPAMPRWMSLVSRAAHWTLYILLIAVPGTAILGAWFGGHPVTVFGVGAIGPFFGPWDAGETLAEVHGLLGDIIIWLAGFHASAALYHHFVRRDRVLKAMLPGRGA